MIKAVVFDCFGVLYGGSLWAQLEICPPERHKELIDNNKLNDYGYLTTDEYVANVARILNLSTEQVMAMLRNRHVRNQSLFDMIADLRGRGIKAGLLTNAGRDMPGALFTQEELDGGIFDAYIVSSDLGLVKPNPAIFELMADKLGVATGDCVMIDDTPENCEGAEVAGMQSIQYVTSKTTVESLKKLLQ